MEILVSGSSGFIGSHIVDKLLSKNEYKVQGYDMWFDHLDLGHQLENPNFKYEQGNVLDVEKLKEIAKKSDVIIHLAAILGTSETIEKYSPIDVARVNILGTLNILELARKYDHIQHIIIPSTPDVPWLNPYKITKLAMERFALMYYKSYGVKVTVLKLSNVYGPRERWPEGNYKASYNYQKVVPTFIVNALQNKQLPIFGDGTQRADYVYVEDVAQAFVNTILNPKAIGHVIPIGTGKTMSVNELADLIINLTHSKSRKMYLPMRKGEVPIDICIDTSIARELINFEAITDITEGLKKTIPYYKRRLSL